MSPSEHDLRAALREGEGDGRAVDVDVVIFQARRQRAARRSKLLNAAAAVVVVGGIGTGGAWLVAHDKGNVEHSGAARGAFSDGSGAGSAFSQEQGAAQGSALAPVVGGAAKAPHTCPRSAPAFGVQKGAATGALFDRPVAQALVCAYGSPAATGVTPTGVVLSGADAAALIDSLEQTKTTRPHVMCPDYRSADEQAITVFAFKADGSPAGIVSTVLGRPACAAEVVSAHGVRYDWAPPQRVLGRLAQLHPLPNRSVAPEPAQPSGS